MSRLLVFTTGGTIASRYSAELQGFTTAVTGSDLVAAVPGLESVGEIEVVELANVSSTFLRPAQVFDWAQQVAKALADPGVAGAVVTHGTDTLEESAALFDFVIDSSKPVVFTGSMRTSSELVTDGPRNLLCAARVAAHSGAADLGVLVVMNEEIHAAQDVTKSSAESLAAFTSPNYGPLGFVSRAWGHDEIVINRRPVHREHVPAVRLEERVFYIKTVMGADGQLVDAAVAAGARGLVIEAFGGGEITPFMAPAVEAARRDGVEVVVATRSPAGRPLDLYADLGEGKWLREQGVKFSGYLNGPKARIKLMLVLGLGQPGAFTSYF
jgi:L-asparaginase